MNFQDHFRSLDQGRSLESPQMEQAIAAMMDGSVPEEEMAKFLLLLKEKGETVGELVGAARAMRSKMTPIHSRQANLVDTCGTGGDGSGTFNISTAAAIVAATVGIPVAKHGNRAISSQSGSADALRELGVNVDAGQHVVEQCLEKTGICFCFAPLFHASVRHVAAARKKLGVPTIFNMLGPLCNPAGAGFQIVGVGKAWQRDLIARALQQLGTVRSVVVHGKDGICEISNADESLVTIVEPGKITEESWKPEDFGLSRSSRSEILAEGPAQSADRIREALSGQAGGARDIVVLNSATAIWLTKPSLSLKACAEICQQKIDSGEARKKLQMLVAQSLVEPEFN